MFALATLVQHPQFALRLSLNSLISIRPSDAAGCAGGDRHNLDKKDGALAIRYRLAAGFKAPLEDQVGVVVAAPPHLGHRNARCGGSRNVPAFLMLRTGNQ